MTMRRYKKPYRIKKKKSILKNRFFWLGILLLIFIGTIFYFLIFSSFFQVEKIIVSGEKKVSKEEIVAIVEENLEKKILFFPSRSIFLVNLNKIREDISNTLPKIAEIEMSRTFPDALNILVIERLSLATWCQEERCFFLDKEGIIFEETSEISPNNIKIKDLREKKLELGEKVLEKEILDSIGEIEIKLRENLKINIEEFIIASDERLNVKTNEGWEIYFNLEGDLDWQLTKLNLVLKEKIPPEKRKDLEYIELRFGDLATFRYKQ